MKYFPMYLLLVLVVSCDKDFLSEDPKGILDPAGSFISGLWQQQLYCSLYGR